jgi:(R)-2-hydroxyacyl-CoA dehydratese activating ATPase
MSRFFAGIDIGSLATKAVVIDGAGQLLGRAVVYTGANNRASARRVFERAVEDAGLKPDDIHRITATGYGRENVPFVHERATEITCHARGNHHLIPEAKTILDIGGQDTKTIRIGPGGKVLSFAMNDRCAAGTGRFLEMVSRALEVGLDDMGRISEQATESAPISSMCAVFAESEVVSLVSTGTLVPNILRGVHDSIASRAMILLRKVGIAEPVAMSGGVAMNAGLVRALEERIKSRIRVAQVPQVVGALGAALIGAEREQSG